MNKNKKIIIGICIIALIVIVVLVVNLLKKSDSIISFSETEIERAYITNGNNGNVTEIKNENINLIYSNIKNMNVEEIEKNETSGWQYYIDFQLKDSTKRVIIVSSTVFENAIFVCLTKALLKSTLLSVLTHTILKKLYKQSTKNFMINIFAHKKGTT